MKQDLTGGKYFHVEANVNAEMTGAIVAWLQAQGLDVQVTERLYEVQSTASGAVQPVELAHQVLVAGERPSLTEMILRNGTISRHSVHELAAKHGYKKGSVSPLLVKLCKTGKLKRVGVGAYQTVNQKRAAKGIGRGRK